MNVPQKIRELFAVYHDTSTLTWNLKFFRIYAFMGMILTPFIYFILQNFLESYTPWFMFGFAIGFALIFVGSYKSDWAKHNIDSLLLGQYIIMALYAVFDVYFHNFSLDYSFALTILLFLFGIALNNIRHIVIFFTAVTFAGFISIIIAENPEVSKPFLFSFFIIFYAVGFFVIRHKTGVQDRLQEREQFLTTLFNKSFDAVMLVDFFSREVFECNDFAMEFFEVADKSEIIGFQRDKFQKEKLSKEDLVNCRKELASHGVWEQEALFITKKGREKWVQVRIIPLEIKNNRIYVVRMSDITDKKKIRERIQESEVKYRKLYERNLAGVFQTDMEGNVSECNPAVIKLLGFEKQEELLNLRSTDFFYYPDEKKRFLERINTEKLLTNNQVILKKKDGTKVHVLQNASLIYNDLNEPVGVEGTLIDVSDVQDLSKELKQKEAIQSMVLNSISIVLYHVRIGINGKRKLEYIGEHAEDVFGFSLSDYENGKVVISDHYHPDDRQLILDKTNEIRNTKSTVQMVYRFKHVKKQVYKYIEENIFPEFDDQGNFIGTYGVARDVTESKSAENKLVESEQRFRKVFEDGPLGMCIVSLDGEYLMVNNTMCKMLGYDEDDLCYPGNINPTHPEDRSEDLLRSKELFTGNVPYYQREKRYVTKSGNTVWARITATVVKDGEGIPLYGLGMVEDITTRKSVEINLKASEIKYRNLIENSSESIVIFDSKSGKFIDFNQRTVTLFGYSREELLKMGPKELTPEEFFNSADELSYSRKALVGETVVFEWIHVNKKGKEFPCEIRLNKYPIGENYLQGAITDITFRKQSEEKLTQSEARNKAFIQALPDMVFILNKEGVYTDFKAPEDLEIPITPEQIIGKKVGEFYYSEEIKLEYLKKIKDCLKTGEKISYEYQVEIEGEFMFLDARIAPLNENEVLAVVRNVTKRKEAEREIVRSREQFQSIVEKAPDGIITLIREKIVYANPIAISMFGVESKYDLIGRNPFDFLTGEDAETGQARINQVFHGIDVPFKESELKRPDGSTIKIEGIPVAIQFNGQDAIQIFLHDLSDRENLEIEKVKSKVAEEANVALQNEIKTRVKVEKELIKEQGFSRSIIDSSIDMICAADKEGFITEFNKAAQRVFGYKKTDIIGKHISVLYSKENQQTLVIDDLISGSGNYTGEIINIKADKSTFTAFLSASVLKDKDGNITGMMGISRDITEIKKAEEELRVSEERYRDLFENATDMIQSVDVEGNILFVNDAWKNKLGYSNDQVVGSSAFKYIHEDSLNHCKKVFGEIMSGIKHEKVEVIFKTKRGKRVQTEGNITSKFENNNLINTRGIFRDVSKEKLILLAIRESQERYQALFDQAFIGIAQVSLAGKFLNVNKRLSEIMGFSEGEMVYMNFLDVTHPDDISSGVDLLADLLNQNMDNITLEKRFQSKSGDTITAVLTVTMVKDEEHDPSYYVMVFDDISERKLKEKKLQRSLKEKEILLQEVHHRVKNNLQVISSILNLQSSYVKDKNTLEILKESQNRIKSMSYIHESLYQTKDFSRINFSEYLENISVNLVHSYQVTENRVKLNLDIKEVYLKLDHAIPCGLIVNELVSNALKYAFPNTKEGNIFISLDEQVGEVEMMVADDGIGLPENFKIEEVDSLGLQLVYTLTEQLNGKISIEKEGGTKILITFRKSE